MQVLPLIVEDVAGDLRATKAPELEQRLRIVGEGLRPVVVEPTRLYGFDSKTNGAYCRASAASMTITCRPLPTSTRFISTRAGGSKRPSIAARSQSVMSATSWPARLPSGPTPICTLPPSPFRNAQSVSPARRSSAVERLNSYQGNTTGVVAAIDPETIRSTSPERLESPNLCREPGSAFDRDARIRVRRVRFGTPRPE